MHATLYVKPVHLSGITFGTSRSLKKCPISSNCSVSSSLTKKKPKKINKKRTKQEASKVTLFTPTVNRKEICWKSRNNTKTWNNDLSQRCTLSVKPRLHGRFLVTIFSFWRMWRSISPKKVAIKIHKARTFITDLLFFIAQKKKSRVKSQQKSTV